MLELLITAIFIFIGLRAIWNNSSMTGENNNERKDDENDLY